MKILIGIIIGAFFFLILGLKKVWAFLDLTPETCSFNTANMLPDYKDPGTLQYFGKILENTGYNWRHSGQAMIIEDELLGARGQKTYDTGRNYVGSYVLILYDPIITPPFTVHDQSLPKTIDAEYVSPRFQQLTTTYEPTSNWSFRFDIRALATGGFSIYNNNVSDAAIRYSALIIELRKITGA